MDIRKYLNTSQSPKSRSPSKKKKVEPVVVVESESDSSSEEEEAPKVASDGEESPQQSEDEAPDALPGAAKKSKTGSVEGSPPKQRKSSSMMSEGAFPTSKLRMIMKSVPTLDSVGMESLAVINKATEMFTTFLCVKGFEEATRRSSKCLEYDDLATLVKKNPKLQWIEDVLTERITYAEYLAKEKEDDDYDVL